MQKQAATRTLKEFFLKQMEEDKSWGSALSAQPIAEGSSIAPTPQTPNEVLLNVKVSISNEQFNNLLQQDAIKKARLSLHLSMDSTSAVEYPLSKSEWFLQQNQPLDTSLANTNYKTINFSAYQKNRNPFSLSPREFDIIKLLAQGLLYKEIACELGISIFTVKNHLKKIYPKLGVTNRSEAILKYLKFSQQ